MVRINKIMFIAFINVFYPKKNVFNKYFKYLNLISQQKWRILIFLAAYISAIKHAFLLIYQVLSSGIEEDMEY